MRHTDEADYHPFKAYARSKLANVLFTRALARRLSDKSVFANSCHPGGIMTNLPKHAARPEQLMQVPEMVGARSYGSLCKLTINMQSPAW